MTPEPLTAEEEANVRAFYTGAATRLPMTSQDTVKHLLATLDRERERASLDVETLAEALRGAKPCSDPACPDRHFGYCDREVAAIAAECARLREEPKP